MKRLNDFSSQLISGRTRAGTQVFYVPSQCLCRCTCYFSLLERKRIKGDEKTWDNYNLVFHLYIFSKYSSGEKDTSNIFVFVHLSKYVVFWRICLLPRYTEGVEYQELVSWTCV